MTRNKLIVPFGIHLARKIQSGNTAYRQFSTFWQSFKASKSANSFGFYSFFFCHQKYFNNKTRKMSGVKLAPTVKLNNGYEMPIIGLGTYELKKSKCEQAVFQAIEIGYRHIDTAFLYQNEKFVGNALRTAFKAGNVKREDIFLVTKLWNTFHEPAHVDYACRLQLDTLKVDYIDLYLMHSPVGYPYINDEALMPHEHDKLLTNDVDFVDTYKAMEKLVDLGLVRSLGLSNFNSQQIERILQNCSIKPVTNQVECHPALNQNRLIEFCRQYEIVITAYSPLARPKPSKPVPTFYETDCIKELSLKYNKTPAQVVLRYLVDIGTVPIPKAAQHKHLVENINIFDFKLTKTEIMNLGRLNKNQRLWKFEKAQTHQYWPYNLEF